jgi:hypothetical protein
LDQSQLRKVKFLKTLIYILSFVFMSIIVGGVAFINATRAAMAGTKFSFVVIELDALAIGGYMITALICGTGFIWTMIVDKIVPKCNHKTRQNQEQHRIISLLMVKMFSVFYPFWYTAFMKQHVEECPDDALGSENCLVGLEQDLLKFFVVHMMITCAKVTAFTMVAKAKVKLEKDAAEKKKAADDTKKYGYLEMQAKCEPAQSLTDDFVDIMVSFALVSFYATVLPSITICAVIANIFDMKLLAMRYMMATRRGTPSGDEGIGIWMNVFGFVAMLAGVVVPALLSFDMHPIRDYSESEELLFFLGMEHAIIALRMTTDFFFPETPANVKRAYEFVDERLKDIFLQTEKGAIKASDDAGNECGKDWKPQNKVDGTSVTKA